MAFLFRKKWEARNGPMDGRTGTVVGKVRKGHCISCPQSAMA